MAIRKKILLATKNRGKLVEIRAILGTDRFEFIPVDTIRMFPEILKREPLLRKMRL
ncbi:MAG: hypothetical protein IPG53_18935 [Ignavibacteriales bacterium]|nr:hypothetical protein [Ignavibacteriales bacterium]